MEFRYHPIIEGMKVSEDGSIIFFDGKELNILEQKLPHTRKPTLYVSHNRKKITVQKLVCEAWHGIAPTGEHAARKIDENLGIHYSNLCWGKKGMTVSSAKGVIMPNAKMNHEIYNKIIAESKSKSIKEILIELNISENRFYQFRKNHVKK